MSLAGFAAKSVDNMMTTSMRQDGANGDFAWERSHEF